MLSKSLKAIFFASPFKNRPYFAEAFGLDVELHVSRSSHLHCMSTIKNTNYFGHWLVHPETERLGSQGFEEDIEKIDSGGNISVPDGSGLGLDIDWDFIDDGLEKHILIDESGASGLV